MPSPLFRRIVAGRSVTIVATDRDDGDVHPERVARRDLVERQVRATGRRWTMLDEVHGVDVVSVDDLASGADATCVGVGDVLVSSRTDLHVAVWTADCAPIFLLADDGTVVGAHGGWKGLAAGVVDVAVRAARRNGGQVVSSVVGPVIGSCCYEFGADELRAVAAGTHADVDMITGRTSEGTRSLDVAAAVRAALGFHDVLVDVVGPCTGCGDRWFSHRMRSDLERQATVAMVEAAER